MDVLPGKKTYILIAIAFAIGLLTYAQGVVTDGFNWAGLFEFIKSEASTAAIATIRLAIGKK